MKIKKLIVVLIAIFACSLQAEGIRVINEKWSTWVFLNSGREVVQWNYTDNTNGLTVIEFRTSLTNQWVMPVSATDYWAGSTAWAPHLPAMYARVKEVTEAEYQAIDSQRYYLQWQISLFGGQPFDYAFTSSGTLVSLTGF